MNFNKLQMERAKFLALMGATLLSANALADPSIADFDANGDKTISEDEKNWGYELKSADDLYWFMEYVNNNAVYDENTDAYLTKANAFLANNITVNNDLFSKLDEDGIVKSGEEVKEWFPIGYYIPTSYTDIYFGGTFDGNGHTISGLYFNNENQGCVGLFGQIDGGATIKNVGVIDSYFKGKNYVGGVCGYSYGTIANCYSASDANGSYYIGGVCGYNEGTIENCYNTGKVEGSNNIGGVCGYNYYSTITNCYYLDSSASEGIGAGYEGEATAQTADQFADGTVAQALRGGTNGNVWGQYIGVDKSPTLTGNYALTQITAENREKYNLSEDYVGYYAISNADELYWFAGLVNGKLIGVTQNASANAVLTANITVNENLLESLAFDENGNVTNDADFKAWFPIGYYIQIPYTDIYYSGTFDGNGHTISGLYFNNEGQTYVGLFGQINGVATIKNVGVADSYIKGDSHIGGVCGANYYAPITNCYNTGKVSGGNNIGGVCGDNVGIIENCYNTGKVSGGNGSKYIGGVCGYNYEGTIENCYNTDEVSGGNYVGGVCGDNDNGTIENCYDFKLNSGTLSEYSIVVENNTIALPTEDMVSREGYQFGGWCTDEACEGEAIISEAEFNNVHTLYAKWTEGSTQAAIKAVEAESNKTIKTIKDGQIVIIRNGVMYDMQGRKL